MTMTSVIGHLTGLDFERQYKGWLSCPPGSLFEAPVQEAVDKVCDDQIKTANGLANSVIGQAANCREHSQPSQIQQGTVYLD